MGKLPLLKLSQDERIAYDKYWQNVSFKAILAETHQVKLALAKEEGVQVGEQKTKTEIAIKMLQSGISDNQVADIIGISLEELDKIKV